MNKTEKIAAAKSILMGTGAGAVLRRFLPRMQLGVLGDMLRREEREFFAEKIIAMDALIRAMPVTYEQDGKGMDAIVHLHYFGGSVDIFVTEKDKDWPEPGDYDQSFGWVSLFGVKSEGELGYTSVIEVCESASIELDLYWKPKTLKECIK